jgi:transcriptional antiterminator RfaH
MRRWYAAKSKFNETYRAERELQRSGFEVFCPRLVDRVVDRGKVVEQQTFAFAPYLFVALSLLTDPWERVNATRGVQRLMPLHCERPEPLPVGVIEDLQGLTASGFYSREVLIDVLLGYAPGDDVAVVGGTYEGHKGKFLEQRGRMIRLMMLVLGGVPVPVTVPVEQVEWPQRLKEMPKVVLSRTSYLRQHV